MELARRVGQRDAIAGDDARSARLERAPGRAGRRAVERGIALERGAFDIGAAVQIGGIVLVAQIEFRLLRIAAIERDVAPPAAEIEADQPVDREFAQIGAFGRAILRVEGGAGEIGLEHIVDHARDGVRPVERRRAVAQHLDALDRADGDGVGVEAEGRDARIDHAGDRLRRRVQHGASAVDQQQCIALAQAAQRHGRYVAARRIARPAAQHLLVERHAAQLRDGSEQVAARHGGDGVHLLLADDADRQRAGRLRALDLRADDDDLRAVIALRLGGQGSGGDVRHGAADLHFGKGDRAHRGAVAAQRRQALVAQRHHVVAVGRDHQVGAANDALERLARIIGALQARCARVAQLLGRRDDLQAALQGEGRQHIGRAAFGQVEIALLRQGRAPAQRQCAGAAQDDGHASHTGHVSASPSLRRTGARHPPGARPPPRAGPAVRLEIPLLFAPVSLPADALAAFLVKSLGILPGPARMAAGPIPKDSAAPIIRHRCRHIFFMRLFFLRYGGFARALR